MVNEMQCEYVAQEECTRYSNQFGNLYLCHATGKHHICDQNCTQRVNLDPYTQICRISQKVFRADSNQDPCRLAAQKRCWSSGVGMTSPSAKRQHF